jgi:hypothetical protein
MVIPPDRAATLMMCPQETAFSAACRPEVEPAKEEAQPPPGRIDALIGVPTQSVMLEVGVPAIDRFHVESAESGVSGAPEPPPEEMLRVDGNIGECPALSTSVTVNELLPDPLGVPLMIPEELRVNPEGNEPDVIDQVRGAVQFTDVS